MSWFYYPSPISLVSMVSMSHLTREITPMEIEQGRSIDKQIQVEITMLADSHPIYGQNSSSDADLSLLIDQYYMCNSNLRIPCVHTVEEIMQ